MFKFISAFNNFTAQCFDFIVQCFDFIVQCFIVLLFSILSFDCRFIGRFIVRFIVLSFTVLINHFQYDLEFSPKPVKEIITINDS